MQLYHHKTDGGAEYLTDKFIICNNGHKEGVFKDANFIIRIDGDITKDAEIDFNLTDKSFILNADNTEISSLIESFLNRLKRNDFGVFDEITQTEINLNSKKPKLVILDKAKARIIREMKRDFKKYLN